MNKYEESLMEAVNNIELLLKEKFSDSFNGLKEYADRMNFHNDEGVNVIDDWSNTLNMLTDINNKVLIIKKGKKESNTLGEDAEKVNSFMEVLNEDNDPLQRFYIDKGYVKDNEIVDEEKIEYEDHEYSMYVSYKSLFIIAPLTITVVAVIVIMIWVYFRLKANLL